MKELGSNADWRRWGKEDPLFAVSSWKNKQKAGSSPWTEDEFYAMGKSDWEDFRRHWRQYGMGAEICLEIGCGAGRITKPLSRDFQRVYAVDVSDEMVRRARAAAGPNVEFFLTDGLRLPRADESVTAVFSTHVLQHLDDAETGYAYFREILRVLETGGTAMVHLPLYELPGGPLGSLMRATHALSQRLSRMRAEWKRRRGIATMRGTPYPIQDLYVVLVGMGFRDVEFRVFPVRSNGVLHPFVLARK